MIVFLRSDKTDKFSKSLHIPDQYEKKGIPVYSITYFFIRFACAENAG
jgi:hypothetical protein